MRFFVIILLVFPLVLRAAVVFPPTPNRVEIQVVPNPNSSTYGIQEALNQIPAGGPGWGTNVTGALIQLGPGDYYLTNAAFYSNTFPTGIRIVGSSLLSTRLIYAGLGTTTNMLTFKGGGNPNGGLNLNLHIELEDLTFTSITNMQGRLLVITNESYLRIAHCNFTGWEMVTNNLHGAAVSIDGPAPSQAPGNVGCTIGSPLSHMTILDSCFFAGLATGFENYGDHFYGYNLKSAFIGIFGVGQTAGTAWANTSPHSLGAFMLFRTGLNINITDAHFYGVTCGIVLDNPDGISGVANVKLTNPQWEGAPHALVADAPASQTILISSDAISDDGPSGRYSVSHGPYAMTLTTAMDVRYAIWSKLVANTRIDGNGGMATNFSRFAAITNLCPQPAAGFTPAFSVQNETASTNNGANTAVIFAAGTLPPAYGGDMTYHEVLVHKTTGNDGPIILPVPYVTNISGVFRCTNNTLLEFRLWPGILTNVFSRPIN